MNVALDETGLISMISSNNTRSKPQRGFSLVEVLIALVILSVGMLGIAGLYVQSMQAGRTSMFRHHAVTLAGDIADRIRANPRAGIAYAGAGADNNCVLGGVDCNEAAMAANDIFLWDQQAVDTLPNGDVAVLFDNTVVPPTYAITVSWDEPGEPGRIYTITIPVRGL
jgi:type IV pilus assembly protein PilV